MNHTRFWNRSRFRTGVILLMAGSALGCSYQRYITNTARSATEQLLVSQAIERTVAQLEWPAIADRKVAIETVALNESDSVYLKAELNARARSLGATVSPAGDADWIVVAHAGGMGTVERQAEFGVPSLPTPFGVTPSLPFVRIVKQRGYAKVRLVVHDVEGNLVFESPPVMQRTTFDVYGVLFLAFLRNDIYPEDKAMGVD